MKCENRAKIYSSEIKGVISCCGDAEGKTRGEKMKVSLAMLLKTHGEKMSLLCLLAMLMITNQIKSLSGDVDENKRSYLEPWVEFWILGSGVGKEVQFPGSCVPRSKSRALLISNLKEQIQKRKEQDGIRKRC